MTEQYATTNELTADVSEHWEIGGYLELERNEGTLFHDDALALNCGRGCIAYLVEAKGIESVLIPDLMCDAVPEEFSRLGVSVESYQITKELNPDWPVQVHDRQWLYINDYYGQLSDESVELALEVADGRVIVDETQGYFSSPRTGVDTLYTCRKYFGVPDGGFLYTDARLDREPERDVSWGRMKHILGRIEEGSSTFFPDAQRNNDVFKGQGARTMSILTENMLRGIDYERVKRMREKNFSLLAEKLNPINSLQIVMPKGPFAYPLYVEDGPRARQILARYGVFVPTLWPNVVNYSAASDTARMFATNILPLPVDQRYGAIEMNHILKVLFEEGIV